MMTAQQKILKLKERISIGLKVSRFLLLTVIVSLTVNSVLAIQLYKANIELSKPEPIYAGTGSLEKLSDNMFQIVENIDLEK